jgi:hypothetical protein
MDPGVRRDDNTFRHPGEQGHFVATAPALCDKLST